MNLRDVIKAYVADRGSSSAISTTVAARSIDAVMSTREIVTRRELEEMIVEEAIQANVPVHFDRPTVASLAA